MALDFTQHQHAANSLKEANDKISNLRLTLENGYPEGHKTVNQFYQIIAHIERIANDMRAQAYTDLFDE